MYLSPNRRLPGSIWVEFCAASFATLSVNIKPLFLSYGTRINTAVKRIQNVILRALLYVSVSMNCLQPSGYNLRGGYFPILAVEVCAAFNGLVFKSFGHERMNKSLSLLSLESGID